MFRLKPLGAEIKALILSDSPVNIDTLVAKHNRPRREISQEVSRWRRRLGRPKPGTEPNWESIEHLDRPARRKMLESLAHSPREEVQLKALAALEDLDRSSGTGPGPKPPLTPAEKVARLSRLMSACGREITLAALQAAEDYWRQEQSWTAPVIYDGAQADQSQSGADQERPGPETGPSDLG